MKNEQITTRKTRSKSLYLVGVVLDIVGLFGGIISFLFIWTVIGIAIGNGSSGLSIKILGRLFWILPCMVADLILKLEAGGYFVILCIMAATKKIQLGEYKLPFIFGGINLLLFFVMFSLMLVVGYSFI